MKNNLFTAVLFVFLPFYAFSQASINDPSVTFYGLDFSKTRLVGAVGFTEPQRIKDYYFKEWNNVLVSEKDKYSITRFFKKSDVTYDMSVVETRNSGVKLDGLVTETPFELEEKNIPQMVSSYKLSQNSGLGLVFIVDSFDKLNEKATVHIVFFDIKGKKVLKQHKMTGAPSGFGFRNYWLGAIYAIMKKAPKEKALWN